jgi:hypothetical protein
MSTHEADSLRKAFSAGVRRHAVALISLAVALFGTSYNTWRNQTTEAHRNVRAAGFMVLDALGQLQEISDRRFFGGDHSDANRISGWGKVTVVRDMAPLVSSQTDAQARALFTAWQENVDKLDASGEQVEKNVAEAITGVRAQVLQELRDLN